MKSLNSVLRATLLSLIPTLTLAACASTSPVPVSNQLACPTLQPAPQELQTPVAVDFMTGYQTLIGISSSGSTSPTKTPAD